MCTEMLDLSKGFPFYASVFSLLPPHTICSRKSILFLAVILHNSAIIGISLHPGSSLPPFCFVQTLGNSFFHQEVERAGLNGMARAARAARAAWAASTASDWTIKWAPRRSRLEI